MSLASTLRKLETKLKRKQKAEAKKKEIARKKSRIEAIRKQLYK